MFKKNKSKKQENKINDDIFNKNVVGITDLIMPDCFLEEKDYVYLGPEKYARIYAINYPRYMNTGGFNEFFQIGSIDISTYIEPIPEAQSINKLTNKLTILQSNVSIQLNRGNTIDYSVKAAMEDIDSLREAIQTNRDKLFSGQTIITVWGKSEEELKEHSVTFEDICSRKGIRFRCLTLNQKEGYLTSLPLMEVKNIENIRNITTGGVACLVPTGNVEFSHRDGIYLGTNISTKSPIFFNNHIGPPQLTNPHIGIFGMAGAGKSVTMKLLSARAVASGQWVIILDPEEEYKKLIEYLGGQYITIRAGQKTGINPFELEVEQDEKGTKTIDIYGKVSEIREMLSMFCEKFRGNGLVGPEITAVEEAVKDLYSKRGITKDAESLYEEINEEREGKFFVSKVKKRMPTLSELRLELEKVEYTKDLAEIMKIITGNGSLSMFDCETTIDLNNKIIGIDLKHLTDEYMKFYATINILSWVWSKFSNWKYKDIRKMFIVDEGWMFTRYENSAVFIETMARRGRKYKISLVIASQMITEFLSSSSGQAIIHQCATKFIMKQDPSVANEVVEFFKLSSALQNIISTFPQGCGVLKTEQDLVLLKIEPFEFEWNYIKT